MLQLCATPPPHTHSASLLKLLNFHTIYFDYICFSPQFLLDTSPVNLSNYMFSLSVSVSFPLCLCFFLNPHPHSHTHKKAWSHHGVWLTCPSTTQERRLIFSLPACQRATGLGLGLPHLPFSLVGLFLAQTCAGLGQYALTVSMRSYVHELCCVCETFFFLGVIHHLCLLQSVVSSSEQISEP